MFDRLEARVHLSAVLTYKGVLIATGTEAADAIEFIRAGAQFDQVEVRMNGTSQGLFPMALIKRISVGGGEGNDFIEIRPSRRRGAFHLPGLDMINSYIGAGPGNDTVLGGGASDTIVGGAGHDLLAGLNGGDVLAGGDGNDRLNGDAGIDTLEAGAGSDRLHGGTQADIFVGGVGTDTVDYSDQLRELRVSLDGIANDGLNYYDLPDGVMCTGNCDYWVFEQDNVLPDVENIIGGAAPDYLLGSAADNELHGGGGFDEFIGLGGADSMYGGDGGDIANYTHRTEDLHLTLDGIANDGAAGEGDFLDGDIETIYGGQGNDYIVGNDGRNRIEAHSGNDTIFAAAGVDEVICGPGLDYVEGGKGNDWLMGDTQSHRVQDPDVNPRQDDTLYGNDGDDWIHDIGHDIDRIYGGRGNDRAGHNDGDMLESIEGIAS